MTYQIVVENRGNRDTVGGVTLTGMRLHLVYANPVNPGAQPGSGCDSRTIADIPASGTSCANNT